MRVTSLLATLAAAVSAASARTMTMMEASEDYVWDVTNWSAGCGRNSCSYDFNITGEAGTSQPAAPAFAAYCSGFGEGAPYKLCVLDDSTSASSTITSAVVAKLLPRNETETLAHIQVSYEYQDSSTDVTYNYTGSARSSFNQFVSRPLNFTITPDTVWGIA